MKVKLLIASTLILGILNPAFSKNAETTDKCETKETRELCDTPENKEKQRLMATCNTLKNKKKKHDKECHVKDKPLTGELKAKCELGQKNANEIKSEIKKACDAVLETPPKGKPPMNCWKYVHKGKCAEEGGKLVNESGNSSENK